MRAPWAVSFAAAVIIAAAVEAADRSVQPIISHIRREPIDSTAVAAIGYSRRLHALEIEFRDGLIYRYRDVPMNVYRELVSAESKARFYNQNIKGKYHCLRVRPRSE